MYFRAGVDEHQRGPRYRPIQGYSAADDQLWRQFAAEHADFTRPAAEHKRTRRMKFVMAGGGTGGHVIPALAVARELQRRGHEPFFIGTRHGMEAKLVPSAGYPIEWIDIGGLNRVGLWQRIRTL